MCFSLKQKCEFWEICEYWNKKSAICMEEGGGEYCGEWNELAERKWQRRQFLKKSKRKK